MCTCPVAGNRAHIGILFSLYHCFFLSPIYSQAEFAVTSAYKDRDMERVREQGLVNLPGFDKMSEKGCCGKLKA